MPPVTQRAAPPPALAATLVRYGLLLVPLLMPVVAGWGSPALLYPAVTAKHFAFRALTAVLFALWLVLIGRHPEFRPRRSLAMWALLAFVVVTAFADALGFDPQRSLWSSLERMEGWIGVVHLAGFAVMASTVFDSLTWWRRFACCSLAAAAWIALSGTLQWLGTHGLLDLEGRLGALLVSHARTIDPRYLRVDAAFGSPVFLGAYLQTHALLAVWFGLRCRGARRWAALLAAAWFVCVCHWTQTRIAELGLLTGGGAALLVLALDSGQRPGVRRVAWAAVGCTVLGLVVLGALVVTRPEWLASVGAERLRFSGATLERRWDMWVAAWQGVMERPLLGWGQECFGVVFDRHHPPELYVDRMWFDQPHNVLLGWLVAGGVLGAVAYVVLLVLPVFMVCRHKLLPGVLDRAMVVALWCGHVTFLSMQLDHLGSYLLMFSLFALAESRARAAAGPPPGRSWPAAAKVGLLAAAVAIPVATWFVNAPAARSAALAARAFAEPVVERRGRRVPAIGEAMAIESFGRSDVREQAVVLATEVLGQGRASPLVTEFVDLAVAGMRDELRERRPTAKVLTLTGDLLNKARRYSEAVPLLERALELSPTKPQILHALAEAMLGLGRWPRAMELARRAYELEPSYREAALIYAVVALHGGGREDALAERLLLRILPPDRWVAPAPALMEVLRTRGRHDLAETILARAANNARFALRHGLAEPAEVDAVFRQLAESQRSQGKVNDAEATLRRLQELGLPRG